MNFRIKSTLESDFSTVLSEDLPTLWYYSKQLFLHSVMKEQDQYFSINATIKEASSLDEIENFEICFKENWMQKNFEV